jgi:uncharacterized membrane protein
MLHIDPPQTVLRNVYCLCQPLWLIKGGCIRLLDYKSFYDQHWQLIWTVVLVVPLAVLALGSVLLPEVFWDGYLYKYLWGPVVADAQDAPQGDVTEGYTGVSTLTYAIVLAIAVLGIWRAFAHLKVRLDGRFLMAMVPWVILGAVLRSLEDAGLFAKDGHIVYLFISPLIYILIGLLVFGLVIVFRAIELRAERDGPVEGLRFGGIVMVILVVPSLLIRSLAPEEMEVTTALSPLLVTTAGGSIALYFWIVKKWRIGMTGLLLLQGTVMACAAFWYVIMWTVGDGWADAERALRPGELGVIPSIALLCTLATAGFFRAIHGRWPDARAFYAPVALILFASHFLDGAATFRGLDAFGYSEKHVVPSLLIDLTGTAAVMLPLKLAVVTAVVYLLDISYREDLEQSPTLGWLVKVAIMVLGLAPGTRDMLRLAMGV